MKEPSSFKPIHGIGVAFTAAMVAVFFWSALAAAAFNGPTQNPSGGNGAISTDASNNVYIGGNLNVSGTISGADLGGSTIDAGNVSADEFGSNTGGGSYIFPGPLFVGDATGSNMGFIVIEDEYGDSGGFVVDDASGDWVKDDHQGDLDVLDNDADINFVPNFNSTDVPVMTIASSGNVGIGTTAPGQLLDVEGNAANIKLVDTGASGSTGYLNTKFGSTAGNLALQNSGNVILAPGNGYALTALTDGYIGIGTTTPGYLLTVNGSTSAASYCISGANCITAWPSGGSTGDNPSASIGTSAVNGSATTFMRSDGAPAINQAATFSFSALGNTTSTANISAASMNITGAATTASTIQTTGTIGKCASSSVTITGATSSAGAVFVSPVTYPGVGLWWEGYVSAANTVVALECAATTTTVTASKFNVVYIH